MQGIQILRSLLLPVSQLSIYQSNLFWLDWRKGRKGWIIGYLSHDDNQRALWNRKWDIVECHGRITLVRPCEGSIFNHNCLPVDVHMWTLTMITKINACVCVWIVWIGVNKIHFICSSKNSTRPIGISLRATQIPTKTSQRDLGLHSVEFENVRDNPLAPGKYRKKLRYVYWVNRYEHPTTKVFL